MTTRLPVLGARLPGIALLALLALTGCGGGAKPAATPAATTPAAATPAATYTLDANAALEALASASNNVADVLAKPDPASASWRTSLGTRLDALAQVDAQARALKPAASDEATHRRLLEITGEFSRAAQLIRTGIEPVNVDNLDQAAQILGASVTKVAVLRGDLAAR